MKSSTSSRGKRCSLTRTRSSTRRGPEAGRLLEAGASKLLTRGTISIQSESHPIEFRKVELLELDDVSGESQEDTERTGWVDLLAGNDLARHWETTGNWSIDDKGVVTLTPRPGEEGWGRFDAYLWLKERYKDFEIEFDYKVEKGGNSGFYFHVGDRKSPVTKGIEVQIYDSLEVAKSRKLVDHDAGGIIPGIPPLKNAAKPPGEWNRFHIIAKGNDLTVTLNGEVVNRSEARQSENPGPTRQRLYRNFRITDCPSRCAESGSGGCSLRTELRSMPFTSYVARTSGPTPFCFSFRLARVRQNRSCSS